MTRRGLSLIVAIVMITAELAFLVQPAAASVDIEIRPWTCNDSVSLETTEQAAFTAACPEMEIDVRIEVVVSLSNGTLRPRGRNVDETRKALTWDNLDNPTKIEIVDSDTVQAADEPAVVFCRTGDGAPERLPAPAGEITPQLADGSSLSCDWYRLPGSTSAVAPTPTATPTPSPTPSPTSTQPLPSPTATTQPPTATPNATRAASPTVAATPSPTPSPTQPPLPTPIDTGPPTMFRGDPAHTGRQTDSGPVGDPVLLWRYPIGRVGDSSPVYAAGMIYIGSETGVFAINAQTGTVLWHVETELPVTATPAVVEGVVYVGGEDGNFYAIDAGTGIQRWIYETGGKIRSSAVFADDTLYFSSYDGAVYALEAETGKPRWIKKDVGDEMFSSPAVVDGTLYIGIGQFDGGEFVVLEAATGKQVKWLLRTTDAFVSSPAILNGVFYVGSDDGRLHAGDITNEDGPLCVFRPEGTSRPIRSSPAVQDGVVYFGIRFRSVYAIDATTCEPIWEFDGATEWMDSSPAIAGDTLYIGSKDSHLYALSTDQGELQWSFETGDEIYSSPVVGAGVVYIASRDGFLYAIAGSENDGDLVPPPAESSQSIADISRELLIDGERYRYDREVPVERESMERIGAIGRSVIYQGADRNATSPIYVSRPPLREATEDTAVLLRYRPEQIGASEVACSGMVAVERASLSVKNGDATIKYIFTNVETDLTTDKLTLIKEEDANLGALYAEQKAQPYPELFLMQDGQLLRYQSLDDNGLPGAFRGAFPFGGVNFAFVADVTADVDPADLAVIGCANAYSVFAVGIGGEAPAAPYDRIYTAAAGRVLAFDPISPVAAAASTANLAVADLRSNLEGRLS